MTEPRTVLVTGATGFIGRRLVPALVEQGHDVRAMTRRPDDYDGPGTAVGGDVFDPPSLSDPLAGADVAIYLVHSLDDPDFERKDAEAARTFARAAADAGVSQIVYLGGLGADDDDLSPHLRSRREVEELLGSTGVPVTALRAGDHRRRGRDLLGADPPAGQEPARHGRPPLGLDPHPADRRRRRDPLPRRRDRRARRPAAGSSRSAGPTR